MGNLGFPELIVMMGFGMIISFLPIILAILAFLEIKRMRRATEATVHLLQDLVNSKMGSAL